MAYNPATDFLGLWRRSGASVSKAEMPGLDYVIEALARAGVISVSASAAPPVVNQATTAWLRTAVPSYSAEGAFFLWDKVTTAYLPATAALFLELLQASAGQNGVSWLETTGGPPINTVGNNGDYAIRTDEPGGIYGPKAADAWPAKPIPGTTDIIGSVQLDQTFGNAVGTFIYRDTVLWQGLALGAAGSVLTPFGGVPIWLPFSSLLDEIFGGAVGSLIYRGGAFWGPLAPGASGQVLTTGGPGVGPSWAPRTAEFPSGTSMVFHQTAAPTGWTKQTTINDYGLRVTSGAVGTVAGTAFSTVFAQTAVGDTTLSTTQMPSHSHSANGATTINSAVAAPGHGFADQTTVSTTSTGGGGPHSHGVNLTLSYTDVIIAVKN